MSLINKLPYQQKKIMLIVSNVYEIIDKNKKWKPNLKVGLIYC